MDCPQCGGAFATYALRGREASVCEDCGYVGIAAEHRGDPRSIESWDDALRRFYRAHGHDGAPSLDLQPPLSRPSGSVSESWDDALRRFYARQTGDVDESAGDDATPASSQSDPAGDDDAAEATGSESDDSEADDGAKTVDGGTVGDADDADGVEADAGGR